jgi:hypothetical protein
MSVLPFPPGQPDRDLLEQPAIAVRVAERRVREVRAPGPVGKPGRLRLLLHLADVDAAVDEIFPGGVDVLDRQVHQLNGPDSIAVMPGTPLPKWIEHCEWGGVICTNRAPPPARASLRTAVGGMR